VKTSHNDHLTLISHVFGSKYIIYIFGSYRGSFLNSISLDVVWYSWTLSGHLSGQLSGLVSWLVWSGQLSGLVWSAVWSGQLSGLVWSAVWSGQLSGLVSCLVWSDVWRRYRSISWPEGPTETWNLTAVPSPYNHLAQSSKCFYSDIREINE